MWEQMWQEVKVVEVWRCCSGGGQQKRLEVLHKMAVILFQKILAWRSTEDRFVNFVEVLQIAL